MSKKRKFLFEAVRQCRRNRRIAAIKQSLNDSLIRPKHLLGSIEVSCDNIEAHEKVIDSLLNQQREIDWRSRQKRDLIWHAYVVKDGQSVVVS